MGIDTPLSRQDFSTAVRQAFFAFSRLVCFSLQGRFSCNRIFPRPYGGRASYIQHLPPYTFRALWGRFACRAGLFSARVKRTKKRSVAYCVAPNTGQQRFENRRTCCYRVFVLPACLIFKVRAVLLRVSQVHRSRFDVLHINRTFQQVRTARAMLNAVQFSCAPPCTFRAVSVCADRRWGGSSVNPFELRSLDRVHSIAPCPRYVNTYPKKIF